MNIRCPIIEVNRDGKKVIMNTCDFNAETMVKWEDKILKSEVTSPSEVPPPPFDKNYYGEKVD